MDTTKQQTPQNKQQNQPQAYTTSSFLTFISKIEKLAVLCSNPTNEKKQIQNKFFPIFEMNSGSISLKVYIERFLPLFKINSELFPFSCYIFNLLFSNNLMKVKSSTAFIKIFGASIWIAHKLLEEKAVKGVTFQSIAGIPVKVLKKMERIILVEILKFNIGLTGSEYQQFKKYLLKEKIN